MKNMIKTSKVIMISNDFFEGYCDFKWFLTVITDKTVILMRSTKEQMAPELIYQRGHPWRHHSPAHK